MIEEFYFERADTLERCYFNSNEIPFRAFSMEVDLANESRKKVQQRGEWRTKTSLGKRVFRCEGDILQKDSESYINKRRQIFRVCNPKEGETIIGKLHMEFTGMPEAIETDVTIEGWPELPMEALSPSRGTYMITWKAFNPALLGEVPNYTTIAYPSLFAGGRGYAKTYGYSYGTYSDPLDATIFVGGDELTYPIVRFIGPSVSPRIQAFFPDGTWGQVSLQGLTIESGRYVDVDFSQQTVVDSDGNNLYSYAAGTNWFYFDYSETIVVRYMPDGGGSMRLSWRNAYTL